jgi:pseudo-rSAM protein
MFEITKNYWVYIYPNVYCCIKNAQALLYHTQTGEKIETDDTEILGLLQALHEKGNLGAVSCEGKMLNKEPYHTFISEFCWKNMGNVADMEKIPEKPIQLMPVLNLQHDVEKLQKESERYVGENILQYLLEINIYLYSGCSLHCPFCNDYFRQNRCCTASNDSQPEAMDIRLLQNLLAQIRYGRTGKINILGGNIMEYPDYEKLTAILVDFGERVHIWNHYANFIQTNVPLTDFFYDIPVTFPIDKMAWNHCFTLFKDRKAQYRFFITETEDYEKTEELIIRYALKNYAVYPVYTGTNHKFFEENVFVTKEDIFQTKRSFRQIFAHQKLNTRFFGSLFVFPNGDAYANTNSTILGNIATDILLDIINKEMLSNTSWRKIRDTAPCSDCLYQYLCPSPFNYELVINKPNLCHVKN